MAAELLLRNPGLHYVTFTIIMQYTEYVRMIVLPVRWFVR